MCGIHGIINAAPLSGKFNSPTYKKGTKEFIQHGFVAGALRGMDSSGMFQIDKHLTNYIHKLPVMGPIFIEDRVSRAFFNDVQTSPITVCHVRAATEGRITLNNAHPFYFERDNGETVCGVHNGTLTGWKLKAGKDSDKYGVDSEWAIQHIAQEGADAFEDFGGSYSFVWWDEANPTKLVFARNKERPMFFLRSKDKKQILFGSEAGMLSWLARRNDIEVEDETYFTKPGRMYSIDFDQAELSWKDLGELPEKKVVAVATSNHATAGSGRAGEGADSYYGRHYEAGESEFGDDDWRAWGHRGSGSSRTSYTSTATFPLEAKKLMIDTINEALRVARDKREGHTAKMQLAAEEAKAGQLPIVLQDMLQDPDDDAPFATGDLVKQDSDDLASLELNLRGGKFNMIAEKDWYSDHYASKEEQEHAKEARWFGEMAVCEPIMFDGPRMEIMCDVLDSEAEKRTLIGYIRGFDQMAFRSSMENKKMHVVIVGSSTGEDGEPEFVLSPLTLKGEDAILKMAS